MHLKLSVNTIVERRSGSRWAARELDLKGNVNEIGRSRFAHSV